MKCYLFVPTGERREVKNDEYYLADNNSIIHRVHQNFGLVHPIVTLHEIEVPDNTPKLLVCRGGEDLCYYPIKEIVIKKPKVKKWIWAYKSGYDRTALTPYPMTEQEVKSYAPCPWYHKIDETEIEEDA